MPRAQRRAFQSSNKKKVPAPFGTGTSLFKNERLSEEVQLLDLDLSASLGQLLLDVAVSEDLDAVKFLLDDA